VTIEILRQTVLFSLVVVSISTSMLILMKEV